MTIAVIRRRDKKVMGYIEAKVTGTALVKPVFTNAGELTLYRYPWIFASDGTVGVLCHGQRDADCLLGTYQEKADKTGRYLY